MATKLEGMVMKSLKSYGYSITAQRPLPKGDIELVDIRKPYEKPEIISELNPEAAGCGSGWRDELESVE
jgi:hypothetical protein